MIRHTVMFSLVEENKENNLNKIFELAETLLKDIEGLRGFNVVRNFKDAPTSNYDFCLIFDFDNMDDLNKYQVHPDHVKFVDFVKTCKKERACIDYEF